MKNILQVIRPHQWIKNIFVLAPLFFTFNFQTEVVTTVVIDFALFSLAASSIYVLNNYHNISECYAEPSAVIRLLGWNTTRGADEMCRDSWTWQSKNPDGYL